MSAKVPNSFGYFTNDCWFNKFYYELDYDGEICVKTGVPHGCGVGKIHTGDTAIMMRGTWIDGEPHGRMMVSWCADDPS